MGESVSESFRLENGDSYRISKLCKLVYKLPTSDRSISVYELYICIFYVHLVNYKLISLGPVPTRADEYTRFEHWVAVILKVES